MQYMVVSLDSRPPRPTQPETLDDTRSRFWPNYDDFADKSSFALLRAPYLDFSSTLARCVAAFPIHSPDSSFSPIVVCFASRTSPVGPSLVTSSGRRLGAPAASSFPLSTTREHETWSSAVELAVQSFREIDQVLGVAPDSVRKRIPESTSCTPCRFRQEPTTAESVCNH